MVQTTLQLMEHMMMQIELQQIGDSKGIGIVNINMRSYYVEGSKTLAFEVAEQLDWQVPDQLIVPVGSGAMLNAICKGFEELQSVSLLDDVSNMHMIALNHMDVHQLLMHLRKIVKK